MIEFLHVLVLDCWFILFVFRSSNCNTLRLTSFYLRFDVSGVCSRLQIIRFFHSICLFAPRCNFKPIQSYHKRLENHIDRAIEQRYGVTITSQSSITYVLLLCLFFFFTFLFAGRFFDHRLFFCH